MGRLTGFPVTLPKIIAETTKLRLEIILAAMVTHDEAKTRQVIILTDAAGGARCPDPVALLGMSERISPMDWISEFPSM